MPVDGGTIGSVGTLVAAALETAGQYLQSAMLDVMESGLANAFGTFLFVFSALVGLFTIGIGGQYKYGLWFLFGPAMFWFMIGTRVESTGTAWNFGERQYDTEQVLFAAEGVVNVNPGEGSSAGYQNARLAWFFVRWDQLVSSTVQAFIQVLQLEAFRADLSFINKMERYDILHKLEVSDPMLRSLGGIGAVARCQPYFAALKSKDDPALDVSRQLELGAQLVERGQQTVLNIRENPDLVRWAEDMGLQDKLEELAPEGLIGCDNIWKLSVNAFKMHSEQLVNAVADYARPEGLTQEDALAKMAERFGRTDSQGEPLSDDQKLQAMYSEVALRMLYKQLSNTDESTTRSDQEYRNALNALGLDGQTEAAARGIRQVNEREAWQSKGDFLTAMLSLPYIQGVMLFLLAMTFPFFCFALIVPGRYESFLLWMGLWVWVKSWDFGFAVVMLIDEMFYELMPRGTAIDAERMEDPALAMKALLENDPSYSVQTYYNIMAMLMAAVPVVTGFIVKKGGSDLMSAVGQGFNNYAGKIGGSMASYQGVQMANSQLAAAGLSKFRAALRGMQGAFTDPEVTGYRLAQAAMQTGSNSFKRWESGIKSAIGGLDSQIGAAKGSADSFRRQAGQLRAQSKALQAAGNMAGAQTAYGQMKSALGNAQQAGQAAKALQAQKAGLEDYKGGVLSHFRKASAALAGAGAEQYKSMMEKKMRYHIQDAVYAETLSPEYRALGSNAVRFRYYNHDFLMHGAPSPQLGEFIVAQGTYKSQSAIKTALDAPLAEFGRLHPFEAAKAVPAAIGAYAYSTGFLSDIFASLFGFKSSNEPGADALSVEEMMNRQIPGGVPGNPYPRMLTQAHHSGSRRTSGRRRARVGRAAAQQAMEQDAQMLEELIASADSEGESEEDDGNV